MSSPHTLASFDATSLPSRTAYEFQPYKPRLTERDLESLFEFIWKHDPYNYEHPRYRLQTALTILLFLHLSLYPTVALSEGFYYKDTTLLVANHNGDIRVLLLICLKDRHKNQTSAKRWSGRTMILVDDPSKRHMCPVTIFLAMALADGAIEGVQKGHHLASLTDDFPAWKVLGYKSEAMDVPIMRRASQNLLSSSRALAPNRLHKMMHAQIQRAGHEPTLETIRDDNRKAATREKKRLEMNTDPPHMLIGRGQGKAVYELLGPYLQPDIMPWDPKAFKDHLGLTRNPSPLDKVVQAQLRFDTTRLNLIACLYDPYGFSTQLQDILWPFIEAASPNGFEPYYPRAQPDERGSCPWCGTCLSRTPMKMHLLRCHQKAIAKIAEETHMKTLQQEGWVCRWGACRVYYTGGCTLSSVTSHLDSHLTRRKLHCEWDDCRYTAKDIIDLHIHLDMEHGAYTNATSPTQAEYCFECGIWTMSMLEWNMHGVCHAKYPSIIYGPVTVNGLLAEAGRCPYCMRDGLYLQIEKPSQYLQHVEKHIVEESGSLTCPHPSCDRRSYEIDALHKHFSDVHHILFT